MKHTYKIRNKMQKAFKHLKDEGDMRRKDLVSFLCAMNNRPYSSGYYGLGIQDWAKFGYIAKVGKMWSLTDIGEIYIDNPTLARKLSKSNRYPTMTYDKNLIVLALETLREQCSDDNNQGQVIRINGEISDIKKSNTSWIQSSQVQDLESEVNRLSDLADDRESTIQSLREANFDADNSDEIHILESKLSTSRNNEMLMEEEANRWLNQNKDTRDLLVKAQIDNEQLKEEIRGGKTSLISAVNYSDYIEAEKDKLEEALKEMAEVKQKRNTLTLQPPPSTELGDFTKAELIKLIKGML